MFNLYRLTECSLMPYSTQKNYCRDESFQAINYTGTDNHDDSVTHVNN